MSDEIYIGGIEGGATHSMLVLVNGHGNTLSTLKGPGTNHWMLGMAECERRIADMVNKGKTEAGIPLDVPLSALCLALSGCEEDKSNQALVNGLKNHFPNLSKEYVVCSDTDGSLATAEPAGGVVLISGTGSNALLINPSGKRHQCGGWGYLLGDEGSAWWIAHRAIKFVFDDHDNLIKPPHPTDAVWEEVKQHFEVEDRQGLLDHCYARFDKPKFAALCLKLARLAEKGDLLCHYLFEEAGKLIAMAVQALYPKAEACLLSRPGGLHIVCVGSVWLSWELIKNGFVNQMKQTPEIKELSLLRLTARSAIGATYLAADSIKYNLPKDYSNNYKVFFNYQNTCTNGNSFVI